MARKNRDVKPTKELTEKLCDRLRTGAWPYSACLEVGISEGTYNEWLEHGLDESTGIYHDFLKAVSQAIADAEHNLLYPLLKAARGGDWKASLELMKRRYPERWGDSKSINISVERELENALQKLQRGLTAGEYERVIRILAEEESPGSNPERTLEASGTSEETTGVSEESDHKL
jgi:hypothetical protein